MAHVCLHLPPLHSSHLPANKDNQRPLLGDWTSHSRRLLSTTRILLSNKYFNRKNEILNWNIFRTPWHRSLYCTCAECANIHCYQEISNNWRIWVEILQYVKYVDNPVACIESSGWHHIIRTLWNATINIFNFAWWPNSFGELLCVRYHLSKFPLSTVKTC